MSPRYAIIQITKRVNGLLFRMMNSTPSAVLKKQWHIHSLDDIGPDLSKHPISYSMGVRQ